MGGIIHSKQCPRKKGQRRRSTTHSSSGKKGMWIARNKKEEGKPGMIGRGGAGKKSGKEVRPFFHQWVWESQNSFLVA